MPVSTYIKQKIHEFFHLFGYQLVKRTEETISMLSYPHRATMYSALKRSKERNIEINTVVDVGASYGVWSDECMKIYPEAFYFLIEAQEPHRKGLEQFKQKHPKNTDFVIAAAGHERGEIYFDNSDLMGGIASKTKLSDQYITVPVTTIDHEVAHRKLKPPFLIKLDTHGFEVPILTGASQTFSQTNLLVIESYNFKLNDDCLRFWELCQHMEGLGFLPIDLANILYRKKDLSFWQTDIFFVRKERPEFLYKQYT